MYKVGCGGLGRGGGGYGCQQCRAFSRAVIEKKPRVSKVASPSLN